jgi:hypothetical protein
LQRTEAQKAARKTPEARAKANAYAKVYRERPEAHEQHNARMRNRYALKAVDIRAKNRQRYAEDAAYRTKHKADNLAFIYGLSLAEFEAMNVAQGGMCAACRGPETRKGRLHLAVDHNHTTGKVRGLLCSACNLALGMVEESAERLEALAQYIRRANAEIS